MSDVQHQATVLELRSPRAAFETLEDWLHGWGFFTPSGEHLVADVFLAYGLSTAIRRAGTPEPPEPCPTLPLLFATVQGELPPEQEGAFEIGGWTRSWTDDAYAAAVDAVRAAIRRGDVYQTNLVQHLKAPFSGSAAGLATRLTGLPQPRDWPLADNRWRVLQTPEWAVVSASPELFLARRGNRVWTMPIKGTRPAGWATELHASTKDAAEHVMIVDLERNDLSRVCVAGSVRWPQLMATEPLAGVEHMVSLVEGELRPGVGLAELLAATFPGGSITGAPKIAAVDLIAALEPVGRGASMGALGRIHGNGDLELALTIRTFAIADGEIHLWVGGGIVWDSEPLSEVAESFTKARPLLEAIGAPFSPAGGAGATHAPLAVRE